MTVVARSTAPLTVQEFLARPRSGDTARAELIGGVVVNMAPERFRHGRAKAGIFRALDDALGRSGSPCEAVVDSVGVQIDAWTLCIPDVLVNCGGADGEDELVAPNPVVVVEVVSPSSQTVDTFTKSALYGRVPSIAHYLVADALACTVLHHRRSAIAWEYALVRAGERLDLDPPGLSVEVSSFFSRMRPREG